MSVGGSCWGLILLQLTCHVNLPFTYLLCFLSLLKFIFLDHLPLTAVICELVYTLKDAIGIPIPHKALPSTSRSSHLPTRENRMTDGNMALNTDFNALKARTMGSGADEEAVTVDTRGLISKVLARYSGKWYAF